VTIRERFQQVDSSSPLKHLRAGVVVQEGGQERQHSEALLCIVGALQFVWSVRF